MEISAGFGKFSDYAILLMTSNEMKGAKFKVFSQSWYTRKYGEKIVRATGTLLQ